MKPFLAFVLVLFGLASAQDVVIGWSGAVTGPTSDAGQFVIQGVEDYCNYANSKELVPGHKIVCLTNDDQYNNDNTLRNFESYLDQGMSAFIAYATGATLQLKVNSMEEEMPILGASLHIGTIDPPDNTYMFLPVTSYSEQVLGLLEWIAENHQGEGKAKVAMFINASPFGRAPMEDAQKAAILLGIEIVDVQERTSNLDYTAMLQRWDNSGVQYVINQDVQSPVAAMLQTANGLGLLGKMQFMGAHYTGGATLLSLAGDLAENYLWATSFALADNIPLQREVGEMAGRSEETIADVNYTTGLLHASIYIEAARRIAEAGGDIDNLSIFEALKAMNDDADGSFDLGFAVSPISYSDSDRIGADQMHLLQVQGGKWVAITDPYNSSTFRKVHPAQ